MKTAAKSTAKIGSTKVNAGKIDAIKFDAGRADAKQGFKQSLKPAVKAFTKPFTKASVKAATKSANKAVAKAATKPASEPAPVKAPEMTSAEQAVLTMIRTLSPPVQPVVTVERPVMAHKYQVGETVYFTSPSFGRAAASGSYTVVKQLPSESDDYQYRIKSDGEAFERVAKESQLDRI
jgi:hypothetical protein